MTKITKNAIEAFAIELFEKLVYDYVYAPDTAPDGDMPERESYEQVLLPKLMSGEVKIEL